MNYTVALMAVLATLLLLPNFGRTESRGASSCPENGAQTPLVQSASGTKVKTFYVSNPGGKKSKKWLSTSFQSPLCRPC